MLIESLRHLKSHTYKNTFTITKTYNHKKTYTQRNINNTEIQTQHTGTLIDTYRNISLDYAHMLKNTHTNTNTQTEIHTLKHTEATKN